MKRCKKCNINVRGKGKICPLCQGSLTPVGEGEDAEILYPKIETVFKQYKLFFKLLILGTVACGIISVAINLMIPQSGIWSLFVLLGIACFWISLALAFQNRNNLSKNIVTQVFIISLICILWDYVTGWKGWSIDYVFPIACMVAMLSLEILAKLLHLDIGDYHVCMAVDIVLGAAPLVFYLIGIINVSIPSILCASVSMIFLTFAILFYGKDIWKELSKRFHI